MSTFKQDLEQERLLSEYLDHVYHSKNIKFTRISDSTLQHQGVDVLFNVNSKDYHIDEKAQLHYLNQDLPTFTFELSYLNKNDQINQGWLLDPKKKTDYYFLITGIFLNDDKNNLTHASDLKCLKITSVHRQKLITHLDTIGLSTSKLISYDLDLRSNKTFGKNPIVELKNPRNGCLYFTGHLVEQPINLQLRLSYLLEHNIAKKFNYL